ncbi:Rne/Rng family ribonuclease [Enteractinococcus coprophilus]|uniref:Ribonuclease E n=1 Tax=Enteractinococcus coprophilus TaxID=1027633 RepID=A0A543AIX8_9MICC|nr:Rne/Rng family ribonuclease [Enteractinococcus coprophilus]TQL72523.1 ribonuclease E [Enteractinococcus coprophilus]
MPAADKTQELNEYTQPSPVAGTPLPDDPTGLLFQAPDYSKVPVRRKKPESQEPQEERSRDDRQHNTKRDNKRGDNRQQRNRKQRDNTGDADHDSEDDTRDDDKRTSRGKRDSERSRAADDDQPVSHRRRRRRRGNIDLEMDGGGEGDPEDTVTRVRAPRQASTSGPDEVTSLRGSTRLEAKRQRRRSTRRGRQRNTVISEAEFLARRESVERKMLVRQHDTRIQIAVLEDGIFAEHFVSNTQQDSLIGNVYLGKVQNVLPSMEAAFVDIGRGRNAVLYAGEVNWDTAQLDGKAKKIENALKSGDSVLVQVTKDPVGHKGARLTAQISLPGRYLVYVPGGSMTGISRKLPDTERNRLKAILKENLPDKTGVIVRTAAEGISEEELLNDINRLRKQWEEIEAQSKSTKVLAPELLHSEPDLTIKVVRDVFNEDFTKMLVEGEEVWDKIQAYVTYVAPDLTDRLEQWDPKAFNGADLFGHYRIDEQLQKALDRKVNLPSGGSLVFDRTEAMTVVDVNTGKFTGSGGNLEETVTKNNLEAAEEIVRQLRLRDIGGIIVVDFIDMVLESNRDLVVRRLVECLGRDRSRHQVAEVTSLGLVQMTRKRMGTGLVEVFSHTCEHCDGRGIVVHDEPVERGKPYESSASHRRRGGEAGTRRSRRRQPKDQQADEQQDQQLENGHGEKAEQTRHAMASVAAATTKTNGDSKKGTADTRSDDAQETSNGSGRRRRGERGRTNRRADESSRDDQRAEQQDADKSAQQQQSAAEQSVAADEGQRSSRTSRKRRRAVAPQGSAGQASTRSEQDVKQAVQQHQPETKAPAQQAAQPKAETRDNVTPSQPASKKRRRAATSGTGATKIQQATDAPEPQGKTFAASIEDQPRKAEKPVKSSAILGVGVPAEEISSPGTSR